MATMTVSKAELDLLLRSIRALTTSSVVSVDQINNLRMSLRAFDQAATAEPAVDTLSPEPSPTRGPVFSSE